MKTLLSLLFLCSTAFAETNEGSHKLQRFFEDMANANENREIRFYSYNLDTAPEAPKTLGLPSIPSVLMESPFKAGDLRKWSPLVSEQYASGQTVEQRVLLVQRGLKEERLKNSR